MYKLVDKKQHSPIQRHIIVNKTNLLSRLDYAEEFRKVLENIPHDIDIINNLAQLKEYRNLRGRETALRKFDNYIDNKMKTISYFDWGGLFLFCITADEAPIIPPENHLEHLSKIYFGNGNHVIWPPASGGIPGTEQIVELREGISVDRYGSEEGYYLGEPRTGTFANLFAELPLEDRAMDYELSRKNRTNYDPAYHNYRVLRPFRVHAATISSWFFQGGGGHQYKTEKKNQRTGSGGLS